MKMQSLKSRRALVAGAVAMVVIISAATRALLATGSLTNTQIQVRVNAENNSSAFGLSTAKDALSQDYTALFATGTGANQASNMYHDRRTLTASSSENLDLAGVLTNAFGTTLTFTKIKAVIIHAASGNTNDVLVGGASSNAWLGWVSDATDIVKVKPNGTIVWMAPDVNGGAVVAGTGDILKVANSAGSTSVTYDITVIGID